MRWGNVQRNIASQRREKMDEMILSTDAQAAHYETDIKGWVDRNDRFWGTDERGARWSGCTHTPCKQCGHPTSKNYYLCESCHEEKRIESYSHLKRKKWNMGTPIYSEKTDTYFEKIADLEDYMEDFKGTLQSLRLLICEPDYLPVVSENYLNDELPDDVELPSDIQEALDNLNDVIEGSEPISFSPGDYAVDISDLERHFK